MTAGATIKLRRDTTVAWEAANPVLADGEPGLDTTTGLVKYGNGITAWNSLPYPGIDPATTMSARGSDPNNWNTMTQMGVYLVNRASWAGTSNAPTDSLVFDGLVQVENVNTIVVPSKAKSKYTKAGYIVGRKPSKKKAIVTIAKGESIDLYSSGV